MLFDLDGTLLDTAPDLAWATNALRAEAGNPPLEYARIRPWVSHGGSALTRLALGLEPEDAGFESARQRLLTLYREHVACDTRPFPGIERVLKTLEARDITWGIVTNKPGWLTNPLLAQLTLEPPPSCVVSGDSLPERKPHPRPLLHAATSLSLDPQDCIYLGDAERDIQAARAAGMPGLVAGYGYLAETDVPMNWGAVAVLDQAVDLLTWLDT